MKAMQTTAVQVNDELSQEHLPLAEERRDEQVQVLDPLFLAYVGGGTGIGNMQ